MSGAPALVLVGHGSSSHAAAGRQIVEQARQVARRGNFGQVRAVTLHGRPGLADALSGLFTSRVLILPMMMCDGETAGHRLRQALQLDGMETRRDGRVLRLLAPIGLHAGLDDIIERRIADRLRAGGHAASNGTGLLVGHGSSRDPASREAAEGLAERLRRRGRLAGVRTAFLSQPPFLADVLPTMSAPSVAIGLFMAPAWHAVNDVPRAIAAAGLPNRLPYLGPVGADSAMVDLIVEAAGDQALTVAA